MAPRPSALEQPVSVRIHTVLEDVRTGRLRVPHFQRDYVWDDDRQLALLDSIRRGYPIGSLLIWRTAKHDLAAKSVVGGGPVDVSAAPAVRNYLLDGHQRVGTLYRAFGPGLRSARN